MTDVRIGATMIAYAAIFFAAGCGWGQWWAERVVRKERRDLEAGRIVISMPANPKDAAATLELLSSLVRDVERRKGQE